ncbi:hypothetical protein [Mycolicibacterium llatzerense]|uniref:hypothetical protein n=1 Tax=Mycolicibacterium llatzerense TaxID=280871 RepID=UPI0008DD71EC|nr:hypothetical protein [Mycolicibacterium llatzerense]
MKAIAGGDGEGNPAYNPRKRCGIRRVAVRQDAFDAVVDIGPMVLPRPASVAVAKLAFGGH